LESGAEAGAGSTRKKFLGAGIRSDRYTHAWVNWLEIVEERLNSVYLAVAN